jgi:DNA-binding transcriptional LysR family regulator
MSRPDWLRTFLAVFRTGSVTEGARARGLTQPAASQHLASLERALGGPLFVRRSTGVEPTQRGRELYARVAEPLDGLEPVLQSLDAGAAPARESPLRFGSSPEYVAAEVLPCLVGMDLPLSVTFGTDPELFVLLERGELDVVVSSSTPPRRSIGATTLGSKRFVLVGSPEAVPAVPLHSLKAVGAWLTGRSWVSYSLELPLTRRFWLTVLGRPFAARLRLVAPDLRAVLKAVELGLGVSLLPTFVCREALVDGRVVEVFPVSHLAPEEPWFACVRHSDGERSAVNAVVGALRARHAPTPPDVIV